MEPFTVVRGKALPLDHANVDTDAIIPKQYLRSIRRTGFGPFLFDDWRYLDPGDLDVDPAARRPNPDFVLNDSRYAGAVILLARANFGCGSSREHAVWALKNYGFRCVIAPSFAEIFFNNCLKNGLLSIVFKDNDIDDFFAAANRGEDFMVDLPAQRVVVGGRVYSFEIDPFRKRCLVESLDEIGLTLDHADAIHAYEARRHRQAPWLFSSS
ncbi:MAG: 3-isopropylmalate dehydratase small subunit [Gammaproteobacteria bacterium]|nr:3-isopropylmalate dehydratase small subunit [Gammaproteobacteria bacterium]